MTIEEDEVLYPTEHSEWKEFYYPPKETEFVVNRGGLVRRCSTGTIVKCRPDKFGYLYFTITKPRTTQARGFRLHRVLALTFIGRPFRNRGISFRELDVNHKDGNQSNFALDNLEWLTKSENSKHAIENELWKFKPVLARNLVTGEVQRYVTAVQCAVIHELNIHRLRKHLKSMEAGRITKDWWVFKHDDGTLWPEISKDRMVEDCWSTDYGIWYARNIETGSTVMHNTLRELAEVLGSSMNALNTYRYNNGPDEPYRGWIYWFDERPPKEVVATLPPRRKSVVYAPIQTQSTNLRTGEVQTHRSVSDAAKVLGVHLDKIRYAIRANQGRTADYLFEKIGECKPKFPQAE